MEFELGGAVPKPGAFQKLLCKRGCHTTYAGAVAMVKRLKRAVATAEKEKASVAVVQVGSAFDGVL